MKAINKTNCAVLLHKNLLPLTLLFALLVCGFITYSTISGENLYGTNDSLFYFWRYGAFTLLGLLGGAICFCIPVERLNGHFVRVNKWVWLGIFVAVAAGWFIIANNGMNHIANNFFDLFHAREYDPTGLGWAVAHRYDSLTSAHLFGGTALKETSASIEYNVLGYILDCVGIVMFIVILLLIAALLTVMAVRLIKARKNMPLIMRFASIIIWIYLTAAFMITIARVFYWLPPLTSHLPFISFHRVTLVTDLCLLGVFMRTTTIMYEGDNHDAN